MLTSRDSWLVAALAMVMATPALAQNSDDSGVRGSGSVTESTTKQTVDDGDKRVHTQRQKTTTEKTTLKKPVEGSPRHHETETRSTSGSDYTEYFDVEAGTPGGQRERQQVQPDSARTEGPGRSANDTKNDEVPELESVPD